MDRYLLQAEELMATQDYQGALDKMDQILALQKEHNLTLPAEFDFQYAQGALGAGSLPSAMAAATRYLAAAGREGEYYRETLKLLNKVEAVQTRLEQYPGQVERLMTAEDYTGARELMEQIADLGKEHQLPLPKEFRSQQAGVVRLSQTCAGQPVGATCWLELANQPGCYFWVPSLIAADQAMTWTAECVEGVAQGSGSLKGVWNNGKIPWKGPVACRRASCTGSGSCATRTGTSRKGFFVEGNRQGRWVLRYADGRMLESTFQNGKQVGNAKEF